MNEDAKKTALRMIPYGMFVLTTKSKDGADVGAATVNWVTQTSFAPPLIALGVKADSGAHQHIKDTGQFAVNVIADDQINMAFTFFKSNPREGDSVGGEQFEAGPETGCPLGIFVHQNIGVRQYFPRRRAVSRLPSAQRRPVLPKDAGPRAS